MHIHNNIHNVAEHLHEQADILKRTSSKAKCDAFARSAYNRYYYATFLAVIDMLSKMERKWESMNHTSCSKVLEGQVRKKLDQQKKIYSKKNNVEYRNEIQRGLDAISPLANLLDQARATREIADYIFEKKICFDDTGKIFLEDNVSIIAANKWYNQCKIFCREILNAWRLFNV